MILLAPSVGMATGTVSLEGDARGHWHNDDDPSADIHVFAISARKTLADSRGDRWMFSGMVEFEDDFKEISIHEAYARYKGPMGRWNITVGRFQLPFSLLSGFSTSRLLYESLNSYSAGVHADGGIMVSGVLGDLDYALAATQGLGVHDDPEMESLELVTGRLGWTFGDSGDYSAGVSLLAGETSMHGMMHGSSTVDRIVVGLDATAYLGLWLTRWELQTGTIDDESFVGGFVMTDYSVLPRIDLTGAARFMHTQHETTGSLFAGLSYRSPWCMIRGGYTYDNSEEDNRHGVTIQLYRLVSWPF